MTANTLETIGGLLALPLFSALTYATAAGGNAVSKWFKAKAANSVVAGEAGIIWDTVLAVVSDIEANEKAALATRGSGALTTADYVALKVLAMTRAKAILKANGLDTLKAMFDELLSGKVEQAVAVVSVGKTAVAAAAIATPH